MAQYTNDQYAALIHNAEATSGLPIAVGNGAINQFDLLGWSNVNISSFSAGSSGLSETAVGTKLTVQETLSTTVPPIPPGLTTSQDVLKFEVNSSGADFNVEIGADNEINALGWPVGWGGVASRFSNSSSLVLDVYGSSVTAQQLISPNPGYSHEVSHTIGHEMGALIAGSGRGY